MTLEVLWLVIVYLAALNLTIIAAAVTALAEERSPPADWKDRRGSGSGTGGYRRPSS